MNFCDSQPSARPVEEDQNVRSETLPSPDQSYETYEYKPLDDPTQQIRLLTLLPGEANSDIHVSIEVIPFLPDREVPQYIGLSYSWGSPRDLLQIIIEDGKCFALPVTKNLHLALLHLRAPSQHRILWIDAVCINQSDNQEKNPQVLNMGQIYKRASSVIAWIGPAAEDSELAVDALEYVNAHATYDKSTGTLTAVSQPDIDGWADGGRKPPLTENQIRAMAKLLDRPWFERLWVWQEILANPQRSQLMCGQRTISWLTTLNAFQVLIFKPFLNCDLTGILLTRLTQVREIQECLSQSVLEMLNALRLCKASDARDRVYGALGFLKDNFDFELEPDYVKSVQQVYTDVIQRYMDKFGNLDFLHYITTTKTTADLASFTPDWAVTQSTIPPPSQYAHGGIRMQGGCISEQVLRVTGARVCHIEKIIPFGLGEHDDDDEIEGVFKAFAAELTHATSFDPKGERMCMLVRALYWDAFRETGSQIWPAWEDCKALILKIFDLPHTEPHEYGKNLAFLRDGCWGRSFFTSSEGHMGLVPAGSREGDVVAVLLGFDVVVTLRPLGNGTYHVVGPTYCDGSMRGEAFLGSLPKDYQMVYAIDGSRVEGGRIRGFHNLMTGAIELEDPRLPALPSDWEQIRKTSLDHRGNEVSAISRNSKTLEERHGYWSDPRFDIEHLQSRGLQFEEFVFV